MIVAPKFYGDEDRHLMWLQHDVYWEALRIIVSVVQEHFRTAQSLLRTSTPFSTAFLAVESYDHRTLQETHDVLAAAWRHATLRLGQLELFAPAESRDQEAILSWLRWLRREVGRWREQPALVIEFASILSHQNSQPGYLAEDRLVVALVERFPSVPWLDAMIAHIEVLRNTDGTTAAAAAYAAANQAREIERMNAASRGEPDESHAASVLILPTDPDDEGGPFGCVCHTVGRPPCNKLPCVTHIEQAERTGTGPLE